MQQKSPRFCAIIAIVYFSLCNKTIKACLTGELQCTDGTCIPDSERCDSSFNCQDNLDESNCTDVNRGPSANCLLGQAFCSDGSCRQDCLTTDEPVSTIVGLTQEKDYNLGPGAISVIAIGCAIAVFVIFIVIGLFVRHKYKKHEHFVTSQTL